MEKDIQEAIEFQRKRLFSALSSPEIVEACTVNNGIVQLNPTDLEEIQLFAKSYSKSITFFIPASGVGSRMFDFLQQFLGSMGHEQAEEVGLFRSHIKSFAFFDDLNEEWKGRIQDPQVDLIAFCDYLLGAQGMNFSATPKALFPFHRVKNFNQSPLEGHLRLGSNFQRPISLFHFTVQKEHIEQLMLQRTALLPSLKFDLEFSVQAQESDSFVFDELMQLVKNQNDSLVRKPAGHGAILQNLNSIESDIIFIKNIDNIQCPSHDAEVNEAWALLGDILIFIYESLKRALASKNIAEFIEVAKRFELIEKNQTYSDWDQLEEIIKQPLRVGGMVKNEGMPGGGPFWVKHKKKISKQIIEKSQIDMAHFSKLTESTHFNPVMMAVSPFNLSGKKLDLSEFTREDLSMAVKKNHLGKTVYYLEKPGLWNGSMYYWNTAFIEIPSQVFSPVKNVMDLLNPSHIC